MKSVFSRGSCSESYQRESTRLQVVLEVGHWGSLVPRLGAQTRQGDDVKMVKDWSVVHCWVVSGDDVRYVR